MPKGSSGQKRPDDVVGAAIMIAKVERAINRLASETESALHQGRMVALLNQLDRIPDRPVPTIH